MNVIEFLFGVTFAVFGASGVFFFKFWKASRDVFYLYFCTACWLLAIERVAIIYSDSSFRTPTTETAVWIYLIRLVAFLFILVAIVNKNRVRN
jgi:hypothetical protein